MKKIELKKPAIIGIYTGVCILLLGTLSFASYTSNNLKQKDPDNDYQYVSRLFGDDVPVVNTQETIIRPYTDSNIKIIQNYYNYKGEEKDQENSIINYEQTYIQNSGVAYGGIDGTFDVVSVLPGTVTSIKEDKLLGNIIEIKNSDRVTTIYKGLTDITLNENDAISQGTIIGKSSETNINKDLGSHVVFELKIDGKYVNPEEYYDKNINEL